MSAAISAVLALINQLLPMITSVGNASLISSIITTISSIIPIVVSEIETAGPAIKNIIAALSASPATNADQLAQLQTLDKQVDDAFDAAAADTNAGN